MVLKEVSSLQDYYNLKALSQHGPVFLMKYSSGPISEKAHAQFVSFAERHDDVPCFVIKIDDQKQVSDRVSLDLGIKHESPQVMLFKNEMVAWCADHEQVSLGNMEHELGA